LSGQILYNTFENLEVTNVADNAYALYCDTASGHWHNITADGCCYFAGAYTVIDGLAIETINATTPPSTKAIQCSQIMSLSNVALVSVANSKCQYGIDYFAPTVNINNVRVPDAGAGNQPNRILYLYDGQKGVISNFQLDRAVVDKMEVYMPASAFNGFVFTNCSSITTNTFVYQTGTWTPTFSTNWTTQPTLVSAQYTKIGRQVTVTVYATNGVTTAAAVITGLPFTSNSTQGAGAFGGCSDTTKVITGSVVVSSTQIQNIPALTLTSNYWQITATYFT